MPLSQLKLKDEPQFYIDQDRENTVQRLLKSLTDAQCHTWPYDYWVLDRALPDFVVDDITALPFTVPRKKDFFYGTRESNNNFRIYFTPENQAQIEICRTTADAFKDERILARIEKMTGKDMAGSHLRIEYCQDTDGFWLEPHVDISVKLFSMIIYLSDDPRLCNAGTDIYDSSPEHNLTGTIPYQKGKAMFFMPGSNTWHGFSKRPVHGIRKSLIINYVTSDWRDKWELA